MKFIRDIIAEKTNRVDADGHQVSEGDIADPTISEGAGTLPGEIDPVLLVASGATSLCKESHLAFHAEPDPDDTAGYAEDSQQAMDPYPLDAGDDDGEDFDLLSDPDETDDPADDARDPSAQRSNAAELFADIWPDDQDTQEDMEQDFFTAEDIEPDMITPPEAAPERPVPQTNAEALMQTMYPSTPEPADDPIPEAWAEDGNEDGNEDGAEPVADTNNTSAFHKILRRRDETPEEARPAPEPADQVAPDAAPAPAPPVAPVNVPAPAAGRARRQAGRVKTRLLGFGNDFGAEKDLFAADGVTVQPVQAKFPVGWMVIVSGPGRGTAFTLFNGVSQIGRGEDQAVRLDFGDNSISRSNHAAIAYDPEQQGFFLGHGGKANLVRLNGNPVLSTEPLSNGASIRIGETTLRFVGLCGDGFDWGDTQDGEDENARFD